MALWQKLIKISLGRFALVGALGTAVLLSIAGPGQATQTLYGINLTGTTEEQLMTINTVTGLGTAVGHLSTGMGPFDLAVRGGKLYTFDQMADRVTELNPLTGATLDTINVGLSFFGEGGLAFQADGIGFVIGGNRIDSNAKLYSFDITTLNSVFIKDAIYTDGLAFSANGTLYALSQGPTKGDIKELYTVAPGTGVYTLVGSTGIVNSNTVGGLAFRADGTLFAAMNSNLYTLDTATGAASYIGAIGFDYVSGITFMDTGPVPLPGTLVLLGSGLLSLAGWRRIRKS